MKQTIFILKKGTIWSISSPFVSTLFGLPVPLKVVGMGEKIKILIQCWEKIWNIITLHFEYKYEQDNKRHIKHIDY